MSPPRNAPLSVARRRPRGSPYFDVEAGYLLAGKRLSFDEELGNSAIHCYEFQQVIHDPRDPARIVYKYTSQLNSCPGFVASVASGLRLEGSVYPLQGRSNRFLRGLGLTGLVDLIFWPRSQVCGTSSSSSTCTTPDAATSELRVELGVRWVWDLLNSRSHPSLLFAVGYGLHQFAVEKSARTYLITDLQMQPHSVDGADDHGVPAVRYQYVDIAAGARIPYFASRRWYIGMLLTLHYHAMLDYGEIATQFLGMANAQSENYDALYQGGGYGPVSSGHGIRLEAAPLQVIPWGGLTIRLQGYYEWFNMRFDLAQDASRWPPQNRTPESSARHLARGATDQYFGGILQLGYQY